MSEYNFKFDWNKISTLGKVKVLVEQVVGSPSQEAITQAVEDYIEAHPGSLAPLSPAVKSALLQIAEKVAYIDEHGEDYYDALDAALSAKALLQITAVYTQSGAVYETDSLDSLKADLVVTASYDDGTTADVTSASVLSGTLAEGTSTITVTYQEKTATFNVTVSVYSTTPVIQSENVVWSKTKPDTVSATGFGITKWYDYSFSQEKLESSRYWDATNGYMTAAGWTGIRVYTPDTETYEAGHSWPASANYKHVAGKDGIYTYPFSISRNAENIMNFARESVNTIQANGVSFSIPLSDIDDCYAYWHSTINGAIYPDGVSDGDVIFAGRNTAYYNKKNIND